MTLNMIQYLKQTARRSAIVVLLPAMASAQSDFWEQTNGPAGGTVFSLGVDSTGRILAGSNGGLLVKSIGQTDWMSVGLDDHQIHATLTANQGDIFVGTEAGLFRSTDLGLNWIQSWVGGDVTQVIQSPNGYLFAVSEGAVQRSADFGEDWQTVYSSAGDPVLAINSSGEIFGTTYRDDIVRSTDNGTTWDTVGSFMFDGLSASIGIDDSDMIYLATLDPQCPQPGPHPCVPQAGLFRSGTLGETWSAVISGWNGSAVWILRDGDVIAGNEYGLYRLDYLDSTVTFLNIQQVLSMTEGPDKTLFAGRNGWGIAVSTDDGNTWTDDNEGLLLSTVDVLLASEDGIVLAGAGSSIWTSTDRGEYWTRGSDFYGYRFLTVGADVADIFLSVVTLGLYISSDDGMSWEYLGFPAGGVDIDTRNVFSILMLDDGRIFAGASQYDLYGTEDHGLFLSTDRGNSWVKIALDGLSVSTLAIDSIGNFFGGTAGDGIYRSTDNGASWYFAGLDGLNVTSILVAQDNIIIAGTDGDGVYRSSDTGITWTFAGQDLTTNRISAMEKNREGEIFAASFDQGVFLSTDGGIHWSDISSGLTNASILALGIDSGGFAFAGTEGNAVFRSSSPTTGVLGADLDIPVRFSLDQNYPNPFNPSTTFSFSIPQSLFINLTVFDMLGREIAVVVNDRLSPGTYQRKWDATGLPSGVYLYRLRAGGYMETRKLLLLR